MKRLTLICTLAALLLVPMGAAADDLSARLSRGGFASLQIDSDAGTVEYQIMTDDLGNLRSAAIRRGGNTVVDLNINGNFGSATGSVNSNADLADIEANPGRYSIRVTGQDGNSEGTLQSAGESSTGGGGGGDAVDLENRRTRIKRAGRAIVRVRNLSGTASAPFTVECSGAGGDYSVSLSFPSVNSGQTVTRRQKGNTDAVSGQRVEVTCVVDPLDLNNDPDRSNNSASRNVNFN